MGGDEMELNTESDFRSIPRLRIRTDSDGCPIAVARKRKLAKDHLYFHGPGKLGIYIERGSKLAFTHAVEWYRTRIGPVDDDQLGDLDGVIAFRFRSVDDIPVVFFRGQQKGNLPGVSQTSPLAAKTDPETYPRLQLPQNRTDPDLEQYQQEHQLWPEMGMETEE
jgi:hypothetical protein